MVSKGGMSITEKILQTFVSKAKNQNSYYPTDTGTSTGASIGAPKRYTKRGEEMQRDGGLDEQLKKHLLETEKKFWRGYGKIEKKVKEFSEAQEQGSDPEKKWIRKALAAWYQGRPRSLYP